MVKHASEHQVETAVGRETLESTTSDLFAAEKTAQALRERDMKREEISAKIGRAVEDPDSPITQKDQQKFIDEGLSEIALAHLATDDQKMTALKDMEEHAERGIEQDKRLGQAIMQEVRDAYSKQLISKESMERWQKRLKDRPNNESLSDIRNDLKKFIAGDLQTRKANWQTNADAKIALRIEQKKVGAKNSELPEVAALDHPHFLKKSYAEQKSLIQKAQASLKAYTGDKKQLEQNVRTQLESAVSEGSLDPLKLRPWLEKIFAGTLGSAKEYIQRLGTYREQWRDVMTEHDTTREQLRNAGLTDEADAVSRDEVLKKSFAERKDRVHTMKADLADKGPKKAVSTSQEHIHHLLESQLPESLQGIFVPLVKAGDAEAFMALDKGMQQRIKQAAAGKTDVEKNIARMEATGRTRLNLSSTDVHLRHVSDEENQQQFLDELKEKKANPHFTEKIVLSATGVSAEEQERIVRNVNTQVRDHFTVLENAQKGSDTEIPLKQAA